MLSNEEVYESSKRGRHIGLLLSYFTLPLSYGEKGCSCANPLTVIPSVLAAYPRLDSRPRRRHREPLRPAPCRRRRRHAVGVFVGAVRHGDDVAVEEVDGGGRRCARPGDGEVEEVKAELADIVVHGADLF